MEDIVRVLVLSNEIDLAGAGSADCGLPARPGNPPDAAGTGSRKQPRPKELIGVNVLALEYSDKTIFNFWNLLANGPRAGELRGELRVATNHGRPSIGYGTNSGDWIEWGIRGREPAEFEGVAEFAGQGEGHFTIQVDRRQPASSFPNTGNDGTFQSVTLRRFRIGEAGSCALGGRPDRQA